MGQERKSQRSVAHENLSTLNQVRPRDIREKLYRIVLDEMKALTFLGGIS